MYVWGWFILGSRVAAKCKAPAPGGGFIHLIATYSSERPQSSESDQAAGQGNQPGQDDGGLHHFGFGR